VRKGVKGKGGEGREREDEGEGERYCEVLKIP